MQLLVVAFVPSLVALVVRLRGTTVEPTLALRTIDVDVEVIVGSGLCGLRCGATSNCPDCVIYTHFGHAAHTLTFGAIDIQLTPTRAPSKTETPTIN